jgi:signal transduction histidine kinase
LPINGSEPQALALARQPEEKQLFPLLRFFEGRKQKCERCQVGHPSEIDASKTGASGQPPFRDQCLHVIARPVPEVHTTISLTPERHVNHRSPGRNAGHIKIQPDVAGLLFFWPGDGLLHFRFDRAIRQKAPVIFVRRISGHPRYLPILFDAARTEGSGHGFRTSAQWGYRQDGEMFFAQTWFSSYPAPDGQRVAAIIVDSSDDMRDREEQNLRQLQKSNRITAAAVSHELRNLCGAISLLCAHFSARQDVHLDEDFLALFSMVEGLKTITSFNLQSQVADTMEATPLRRVLDHLRIVIESEWNEIGGKVVWDLPAELPTVVADSHGLLQAFLNLAHNSHRASSGQAGS